MDTKSDRPSPERILFFDLLRIFAISLVVFQHFVQSLGNQFLSDFFGFFGIRRFYWVSLGGVGVTLFLILSGMVLEYNHGSEKYSYGRFILKRIKRIYPSYWLGLASSIILGATAFPSNIVGFLLMATSFEVFAGKVWVELYYSVSWFIGLIVVLYFLYPLLSKLIKKHPNTSLLLILIISAVSRIITGNYWNVYRSTDWFPLGRLFEFSLGIWLINNKTNLNFVKKINIQTGKKTISYFSKLSFPVYLVHLTVLSVIPSKLSPQYSPLFFTLGFIAGTFLLSNIIYYIDCFIQRKLSRIKNVRFLDSAELQ